MEESGRSSERMALRSGERGRCYLAHVSTQIIVLNGVSSSGKTTLARSLQAMLTEPWLLLGIDDLIRAMPNEGLEEGSLLHIGETGQVHVGPGWQDLEASWYGGVASIVANGTGVIVDEVFLGGGQSQERLRAAFNGLTVLWVGVYCDRDVARAREYVRPDRVSGMAEFQAAIVHEGVAYDRTVDTSSTSPESCATEILTRMSTRD
jgi:chloramphenicol 3-O phosphotransferase